MNVRNFIASLLALLAVAAGARAASAALDVIPAPGGPAIHLRVTQTTTGPDGPRTVTTDFELRRTGAGTALLQQNAEVHSLTLDAQGALHPSATAVASPEPELADLLDALNAAHGVMGVTGAGDIPGWSAELPMPQPSAPPLMLPMQAVATNGAIDLNGAVETTLAGSSSERPRSHAQGEGRGGDRGGGPSHPSGLPVVLDVHVSGRIVGGSLAHMTIVETRRIVVDGSTFTNVATSEFVVAR